MDVKAIRDALKARLDTIDGLLGYDTVEDAVNLPAGIVAPASGEHADVVTFDGAQDLEYVVTVLVSKVVPGAAQDALDTYLSAGASNIRAVLDNGAGTYWDYTVTGAARSYGEYVYGAAPAEQRYLGFEIPVTVAVS